VGGFGTQIDSNTKYEYRNSKQAQMIEIQMKKQSAWGGLNSEAGGWSCMTLGAG
jgi:hypothetical protein